MYKRDEVEMIYHSYSADVYRYLLSMCRSPDVAEDLLQTTFLQVIRGINSFQCRSAIKTWIFSIARREFYHWKRKNAEKSELEENVPSDENVQGDCERRDQVRRILDYIGRLEEPLQTLMILRLTEGMSYREIGALLGKTEVWARVTFMRVKGRLVKEMEGESE